MHIIDSHFHWWPRAVFDQLCQRTSYPRAEANGKGGYTYYRTADAESRFNLGSEWFDLERQFAHMDALGHQVDVVCSIGPLSVHFSDLPAEEGREAAMLWNEEMAAAQRKYPGRLWASGAMPLVDTDIAIEVLEHAMGKCGLIGVNIPGSIGNDTRIDAERLERFYDRAEELGAILFLHPTDAVFDEILEGYNGALYSSLGRVIDVSVSAARLIFSGVMERHPKLKMFMSHTGGALPYQAGRLDKNGKAAKLPNPPSHYVKQMYTDTVSPHMLGMKFAIDFYGLDHVMYGSDYPCWSPAEALKYIGEMGLSAEDQHKLFYTNARRILNLRDPVAVPEREAAE